MKFKELFKQLFSEINGFHSQLAVSALRVFKIRNDGRDTPRIEVAKKKEIKNYVVKCVTQENVGNKQLTEDIFQKCMFVI